MDVWTNKYFHFSLDLEQTNGSDNRGSQTILPTTNQTINYVYYTHIFYRCDQSQDYTSPRNSLTFN